MRGLDHSFLSTQSMFYLEHGATVFNLFANSQLALDPLRVIPFFGLRHHPLPMTGPMEQEA